MDQCVLAIDDSPDIHRLLDVRLRPDGLRLQHAFDAEDGIRQAKKSLPDLILLDLDMPNVSGFEVCRRLKEDPATSGVPIIFLTGSAEVHTKVECFDLGAVDYVTKPFEGAELRARVRAALRTKRFQDMLAMRAQIDGLTGLWNRAYFNQRLLEEIAAFGRYGRALSILMLDADHFKRLNDTYGHPFGDRVLQTIGETLSSTCRATDIACRYGGEEFVILLTDTDAEGALMAGERLRRAMEAMELRQRGEPVRVTASIGIATAEASDGPRETAGAALVERADRALYAAKNAGRNCVAAAPR